MSEFYLNYQLNNTQNFIINNDILRYQPAQIISVPLKVTDKLLKIDTETYKYESNESYLKALQMTIFHYLNLCNAFPNPYTKDFDKAYWLSFIMEYGHFVLFSSQKNYEILYNNPQTNHKIEVLLWQFFSDYKYVRKFEYQENLKTKIGYEPLLTKQDYQVLYNMPNVSQLSFENTLELIKQNHFRSITLSDLTQIIPYNKLPYYEALISNLKQKKRYLALYRNLQGYLNSEEDLLETIPFKETEDNQNLVRERKVYYDY